MQIRRKRPGKERRSAVRMWEDARIADPLALGLDVIVAQNGRALGPRMVIHAILDLADVTYEEASAWGITDRYMRRPNGASWNAQKPILFIKSANVHLEDEGSDKRVPQDIFSRIFYSHQEVELACLPPELPPASAGTPFGAPAVEELLDGVGLESIARIEADMAVFASQPNHGIYILTGGPGDGKTTVLNRMLHAVHRRNPAAHYAVYVTCSETSTREQIIEQLYTALIPARHRAATLTIPQMIEGIEQALRIKPLIIVFNDFDTLEERTEGGETVVRDEGLFNILTMLLSEQAFGTRIFIGTTTYSQNPRPNALKLLSAQLNVPCRERNMPRVELRHGFDLIGRNKFAARGAKECYAALVHQHLGEVHCPPTFVTIAFAASLSLSKDVIAPLEGLAVHADEWRPEHFDAVQWARFEADWSAGVDAVRKHDLHAVMAFALRHASPSYVEALRLISLSEDGLKANSLRVLLSQSEPDGDKVDGLIEAVRQGALEPLVRRDNLATADGKVESNFDTNRIFRRLIISLAQEDPAGLVSMREANRRLSIMAYRKYRESLGVPTPDANLAFRRAVMYYTHELASLDPDSLRGEELPDPRRTLSDAEIEALGDEVLTGTLELEPGKRFCHALTFLARRIQHSHEAGPMKSADGLILDLLTRPFHVGYFVPPESSPVHSDVGTLPARLPFAGEWPSIKASQIRQSRWYTVHRITGMVEMLIAEDPSRASYELQPRFWQQIETWTRSVEERLGSRDPTSGVPFASISELVRRLRSAVLFSVEAGERDKRRCLLEAQDLWTLGLFHDAAIAALRVDHDGFYGSANDAGEALATRFGDRALVRRFKRNRIEWMLKRGRLAAGETATFSLLQDLEGELRQMIPGLPKVPTKASGLGSYRHLLRLYHKIGGRFADFAAARGNDRVALTRYVALANSWLAEPVGLLQPLPSLPNIARSDLSREVFTGPSAGNMHRSAVRVLQLYSREPPKPDLRAYDMSGDPPIDLHLFKKEELEDLQELIRRVLNREKRQTTSRTQRRQDMWDARVSVAIERSAQCRLMDLQGTKDSEDWLQHAGSELANAQGMLSEGNIGVVTQLRLLEETARLSWHRLVIHLRGSTAPTLVGELERALRYLNRMIGLADVRHIPAQLINALLLRAEILGCCDPNAIEGGTADQITSILSAGVALEIMEKYHPSTRSKDLDRADALINSTGYRKRMVELTILRRRAGAAPGAHLLT